MNLVGCLDQPTDGALWLNGEDVSQLDAEKLARIRNRNIGFVFQQFNLLPRTTAVDNVTLPLLYSEVPESEWNGRAELRLKQVGLGERMDHHPSQLSGGQQQRVAIARALINDPVLLLADEPTGALDTHTGEEIMALFQSLNSEGKTIVLVTHEPEIAAFAKRQLHFPLRVPVVAVNDSATKHLFDNHFGTGQSTLDGIIRASNILLAGQNIVIVGYGDCGRGVADRADGLGAKVIVVEVDPVRALSAAMSGYRVMTASDAAEIGDVFITVTGNKHVLRMEHFDRMKDGAILANSGHFDIELDLPALRAAAEDRRPVRENLEEFEMSDGRRILLAAEGRLVNLGAAEGHPADVMDMSFSNQALAAEYLITNRDDLEPKIYTLPTEIDDQVASIKLAHLGGGLETLTQDQVEYLSGWQQGT
jgi:S-adenosylhomocysteine hydrolase